MSQPLEVTTRLQDSTLTVSLIGSMDEGAIYPVISGGAATIIFDFAGVDLINSTGLQGWIKFLGSVPAQARVVFAKCSQRVINQLNLFPGFTAGRAIEIESFFAPYFCTSCDQSRGVLLHMADAKTAIAQLQAPQQNCPTCSSVMEFDSIPKKYFVFARP